MSRAWQDKRDRCRGGGGRLLGATQRLHVDGLRVSSEATKYICLPCTHYTGSS